MYGVGVSLGWRWGLIFIGTGLAAVGGYGVGCAARSLRETWS